MSMFHELMMKKKGMPSRYQEVEYIESTGTQYINTRVSKETNIVVNITVKGKQQSVNAIFCGFSTSASQWLGFGNYYTIGGGNNFSFPSNTKQNISANFKYQQNISAQIQDEILNRTYQSDGYPELNNFCLFGIYRNGQNNMSSCQIYSCIIQDENGNVLRNLIPVYDTETQKYGMWESVQGKFYGNDGTGDFKGSIVGYTVVGSPTITDGVVSGFSHDANYLTIPAFSENDNFEACFVFKANTISKMPVFSNNSYYTNGFYLNANGTINCVFHQASPTSKYYTLTTTFVCQANVKYYGKFKRIGNILSFAISSDNISWQEQHTTLDENCVFNSTTNRVGDGGGATTVAFDGEIYIKESWVKVNNKLYFNGQQA